VFVIVGLTAANAKAGIEEPPSSYDAISQKAQPIILYYDPNPPTTLRVPPPRVFSELSIQSSTIQINYLAAGETVGGYACYAWSNEAKTAFNYAASIWESLLNSTVTIEIDACWTEMTGSTLGASSSNYVLNTSTSTWYHESLANSLAGSNIDPADPDMTILYNRSFDWYYGTDGNTPSGKMDFVSVVLHEICHGLGFAGSMTVNGSAGYWGWGSSDYPATYDRFAENGSGTPLLDLGNGTTTLGSALTGGNIYFDGTNANAANGGSRPKLYAPDSWTPGSSYSHLDYDTFNETNNELMVWAISDGESIHNPGPITMGMFEDMGWTTSETVPPPTVASITPNSASNDGIVHITDLSGSDFVNATVKLTKAGEEDIPGTSVTVNSNTITCDFDLTGATAGTWNVVVTNEDEQFDTLVGGFTVIAAPAPDVSISKNVIGSDFSPGDYITFTLDIANTGTLSATNVVVTDDLPTEVLSPTYASTIITPPTGTLSYPHVWDVGTLEIEESGVITIYGQIDPSLASDFSFINTATIFDPDDNTPSNNSDSVLVGECKIYLPLVTRNYPPVPETPVLNAISNTDGDGNYTVSWNTAERADTYTLEEDDNVSFSSPTTVYGPGTATSTDITGKDTGAYYYRVKATNSWEGQQLDSGWSNVRSVNVQPPGPTPGFWEGSGMEFYVTSNRSYVDDFAIYISVSGCGNYKITHTRQESINNDQFSFSGSFYASGTFNSATTANGTTGLDGFYIAGCGTVSGGPYSWSASWQNSSQPSAASVKIEKLDEGEAPLVIDDELYTVTLVE
jgi:uncharacterized repeat protein (TIGR01451 family)